MCFIEPFRHYARSLISSLSGSFSRGVTAVTGKRLWSECYVPKTRRAPRKGTPAKWRVLIKEKILGSRHWPIGIISLCPGTTSRRTSSYSRTSLAWNLGSRLSMDSYVLKGWWESRGGTRNGPFLTAQSWRSTKIRPPGMINAPRNWSSFPSSSSNTLP